MKKSRNKNHRSNQKGSSSLAGVHESNKSGMTLDEQPRFSISYWEVSIFIMSCFIFAGVLYFNLVPDDIKTHITYLIDVINHKEPPPANFLYYLLIYVFSFFSTNFLPLSVASILILSIAVTSKFVIAQRFSLFYYREISRKTGQRVPPYDVIRLISVVSIFAFSIPVVYLLGSDYYYLGHIPPNVWHNSTTIFLMPFALLLFRVSYQQLIEPSKSRIIVITALVILNVIIKPNFFFVFCISYPLMLIKFFRLKKEFWLNLFPVIVGSILLALEYYAIYQLGYSNMWGEKSSIVVSPFTVWSLFTDHIAVSFLASIVFPLTFIAFYWKDLFHNSLLQYSASAFLIAVVIFCLLAESGPRLNHGNFFWQCVVTGYFLYLVVSLILFEKIYERGMSSWHMVLLSFLYILHFLSGLGYLVKIFVSGNFY